MIILKILKKGETPKIIKVTEFPCHIGRGQDNHIVIDDDSISLKHASIIKRDDNYILFDNDSTNGIHEGLQKKQEILIDQVKILFIGAVNIELSISEKSEFDEKTRVINIDEIFAQNKKLIRFDRTLLRYIGIPLFLIVFQVLIHTYFYEYSRPKTIITYVLATIFLVLIVSAPINLFSKLVSKRFNFFQTILVISAGLFLIELLQLIGKFFQYTFDLDLPLAQLFFILISWIGFVYIGKVIFRKSQLKTVMQLSAIILLLSYATVYFVNWLEKDDSYDGTKYSGVLIYPFKNHSESSNTTRELSRLLEKSFSTVNHYRAVEVKKEKKKREDAKK